MSKHLKMHLRMHRLNLDGFVNPAKAYVLADFSPDFAFNAGIPQPAWNSGIDDDVDIQRQFYVADFHFNNGDGINLRRLNFKPRTGFGQDTEECSELGVKIVEQDLATLEISDDFYSLVFGRRKDTA